MALPKLRPIKIRPYQVMCLICRLGRKKDEPYFFERRLDKILGFIRAERTVPLSLRCNVSGTYAYQNAGGRYDTPEGKLFNTRRDLAVLHKIGTVPGIIQPATDIFRKVAKEIKSTHDICGFETETAAAWKGCKYAKSGNYERGLDSVEGSIIPPRPKADIASALKRSIDEMYNADELRIRPHHLLCMSCYHGGRDSGQLSRVEADNLYEAVDICQKNPDIPVRLIEGPCMICETCKSFDPFRNLCHAGGAMNLRDEKKDLDVLQMLGLRYGDALPARELFKRLYEKIQTTTQICGHKDGIARGPEWTICGGPEGSERYMKARAVNLGIPE